MEQAHDNKKQTRLRRIWAGIAAAVIGLVNVGIVIVVFIRRISGAPTRYRRSGTWLKIS